MKNPMTLILFSVLLLLGSVCVQAQNVSSETIDRVVVFARFNQDAPIDEPRSYYEDIFNGDGNQSMKTYFNTISNGMLSVNSHIFPKNSDSYELKYCYFCYDKVWSQAYPSCKGDDISTTANENIGFVIKEIAGYLEESGELDASLELDKDDDGIIDNFVVVLSRGGRGKASEILSPHRGKVSEEFLKTHGPIMLKGKQVKNYTITFERTPLLSHCRFLFFDLGFPPLYRIRLSYLRAVGDWDPMDTPSLTYPLTYTRYKYSNKTWINEIPALVSSGSYELNSANKTANNCYKIPGASATDYWVLEYRDKTQPYEENLPESGLIVYRVNEKLTGSKTDKAEVYIYRVDGTRTVLGDLNQSAFSDINGRNAFSSITNPAPFLLDDSMGKFALSNIAIVGDKLTFDIKFDETGVVLNDQDGVSVFPNPASDFINIQGDVQSCMVKSITGKTLITHDLAYSRQVDIRSLESGVYVLSLVKSGKEKSIKLIVK